MINELLLGYSVMMTTRSVSKYCSMGKKEQPGDVYSRTKGKFINYAPHELRAFYGIGEMAYEKVNGD